jgi:hypothetical protein
MKPGEAIRYVCDECQVVFDLNLAPTSEWVERQLNSQIAAEQ